MAKEPLVSVIVTCHNQADVIEEAVRSVMEQSYRHLECFVVDDGSSDESGHRVRRLVEHDGRLRYLYQAHEGVSAARNHGFSLAGGDYVQFLDGDDLLSPTKLSRQICHITSDDSIDVSYTDHDFCDIRNGLRKHYPSEALNKYPLEQLLFKWGDGVSLPCHAPLYRRCLWADGELPYAVDYRDRCEDWVFLVSIAMTRARFAFLNEVLCTYRVGPRNFTNSRKNRHVAAILAAVYLKDKVPPEYRPRFLKDVIGRALDRYHHQRAPAVLHASKNWRAGNLISRPFLQAYRFVRRLAEPTAL